MDMIGPYIAVFGSAAVIAAGLTRAVIAVAHRLKLYDPREARKVHTTPTPRVGGVAIVLAMLAVTAGAVAFDQPLGSPFAAIPPGQLATLLIASFAIFLVGLVDDVRSLRATIKLAAQLAAAVAVCAMGIRIRNIMLFGIDFGWLGWPITIAWIVGITNAVNLIDGLDGLSAGICAATCAVIAAFSITTGQVAMAILMLTLLGSLGGFLLFNFNPARIFMGDGGSMFLGFFLATAGVVCAAKVATLMGLLLPALALGLPIFDMLLAVVRRILDRQSIFTADRGHIHHRLLDRGVSHHRAVILLYLVTLAVAGLAVLMMALRGGGEIVVALVALIVLMSAFRVAGVLRFRKIFEQVQTNLARSREIRRERKQFESLRQRFRAAWTFDQWWRAARRMARRMGFVRMTITLHRDGRDETLSFAHAPRDPAAPIMKLSIPVADPPEGPLRRVEIDVPADEPLETIGRRVSLFGRLLDEHPVSDLQPTEGR